MCIRCELRAKIIAMPQRRWFFDVRGTWYQKKVWHLVGNARLFCVGPILHCLRKQDEFLQALERVFKMRRIIRVANIIEKTLIGNGQKYIYRHVWGKWRKSCQLAQKGCFLFSVTGVCLRIWDHLCMTAQHDLLKWTIVFALLGVQNPMPHPCVNADQEEKDNNIDPATMHGVSVRRRGQLCESSWEAHIRRPVWNFFLADEVFEDT